MDEGFTWCTLERQWGGEQMSIFKRVSAGKRARKDSFLIRKPLLWCSYYSTNPNTVALGVKVQHELGRGHIFKSWQVEAITCFDSLCHLMVSFGSQLFPYLHNQMTTKHIWFPWSERRYFCPFRTVPTTDLIIKGRAATWLNSGHLTIVDLGFWKNDCSVLCMV